METMEALKEWRRDGDPDAAFTKIVETVTVKTGEYVTFSLKCGLKLTEQLK